MNIEIAEEKTNPFLKRKEIIVNLAFENGTPSKADVQEKISEKFSVEKEHVEVSKIMSEVGKPAGKAWIKIWDEKKAPVYKRKEEEKKEDNNGSEQKEEANDGTENNAENN